MGGEAIIGRYTWNTAPMPKMMRREEEASKTETPEPIRKAFIAEFFADPGKQAKSESILSDYEKKVKWAIFYISSQIGMERDEKSASTGVNKVDEKRLFEAANRFMNHILRVEYKESSDLSSLSLENRTNCFSSSLFLWDVFRRMGKETQGIRTIDHLILTGENYAIDSVSEEAVYRIKMIDKKYRFYEKVNLEMDIPSMSCVNLGIRILQRKGTDEDAYNKANLLFIAAEKNVAGMSKYKSGICKAVYLKRHGREAEAKDVIKKLLEEEPDNLILWASLVAYSEKSELEGILKKIESIRWDKRRKEDAEVLKADIHRYMGENKKASCIYIKLLRRNSRNSDALLGLGDIAVISGKTKLAVKILRDAYRNAPYHNSLYLDIRAGVEKRMEEIRDMQKLKEERRGKINRAVRRAIQRIKGTAAQLIKHRINVQAE